MTITLADVRKVREAATRPERLAFKRAGTDGAAGQMIALDEAEGVVTAIVSVTGIVDEVDDIIEPGAYRETLTKRRPKVCWAHDWAHPIGRVLYIEELLPGDDRLPTTTRDGKAWPKAAGALVATMQFNLESKDGFEAFKAVKFYSETGECEYSIGYQVPMGKATRNPKTNRRNIKGLELYELSVVLFGAHTMTGTLSIKQAYALAIEQKMLRPPGHPGNVVPFGMTGTTSVTGTRPMSAKAALAALRQVKVLDPGKTDDDHSDDVMVAVYPDGDAASNVAKHIAGPDDTTPREDLHVTLAYLGNKDDLDFDADQLRNLVTGAVEGVPVLEGTIGGIGQFPANDDEEAPTWAPVDVDGLTMLRELVADALGDAVVSDHGFTPHMTLGYGIGIIDPVPATPVTFGSVRIMYGNEQYDVSLGQNGIPSEDKGMTAEQRRKKPTMPGEGDRFPIGNVDDLRNAVRAFGRAKDKDKAKRWIIRRARELGALNVLPDAWGVTKSAEAGVGAFDGMDIADVVRLTAIAALTEEAKAGGADRNRGNAEELRKYWTTGEGAAKIRWGTDGDFGRCVRLVSEHMTPERAKGYCANRHKEATGMWPGDRNNKAAAYDPELDTKVGGAEPAGASTFPYLPGTYEVRMNLVREAVNEALRGEPTNEEEDRYEWDHVSVDGTWDDRVIASRMKWRGGDDQRETFEMTYTLTDDGVDLGDPEPVTLQVVVTTEDGGEADDYAPVADALPLAELIENVAFAIKVTKVPTIEGKAGRVLSGRNERRLRDAMQNLIDVLAAAGVNINPEREPGEDTVRHDTARADDQRREVDPSIDLASTAPSTVTGRKELTRAQVAADLRELGIT